MNLTIKSKFRPFTYDEMVKPLKEYKEVYDKLDTEYANLAAQTEMWKDIVNQTNSPEAYSLYKKYSDTLKEVTDDFSKGMNISNRAALTEMKRRYARDIIPIVKADAARTAEANAQYEGISKGIVYEGDAASSSLDRYLHNPSIRYRQANSQEGFKRVATTSGALAKSLRDYGNGKKLDKYTKTWLQQHGYRDSEIGLAISDVKAILEGTATPENNSVLRNILIDEMHTAGLDNWENKSAVMDYYNRVAPALYQAVGQTTVTPYEDFGNRLAAEEASKRRLMNDKDNNSNNFPISTTQIPIGKATKEQNIQELANKYARLGITRDKDGKYRAASISIDKDSNVVRPGFNGTQPETNNTIRQSLFVASQGHRLKTKAEFTQGATGRNKSLLEKYYDDNVQPILDTYNNGSAKGVNASILSKLYDYEDAQLSTLGTSTFIDGLNLKLGTINDAEDRLSGVLNQRISQIVPDNNGGWKQTKYDGTVGDLIKKIKDAKAGTIDGYLVGDEGNEGYIFNVSSGETYYLPLEQLKGNSTAQEMLNALVLARNYTGDNTDEFMNNMYSGLLSRSDILLGGTYSAPNFRTSKQPSK